MIATTPVLPNANSASWRTTCYYVVSFVMLIAIFGVTFWYGRQHKRAFPVFDLGRQVVPAGTQSLEVDQALASFGFSQPLPFFNKNNVVQSLSVDRRASTTSIDSPFLSYRVSGKNIEELRAAFAQYVNVIGWQLFKDQAFGTDRSMLFFNKSTPPDILSVSLSETPDQYIVIVVSLRRSQGSQSQSVKP